MPDMNMSSVASHAGFIAKYLLSNWSLDLPISVPFIIIPIFLYIRGLRIAERKRLQGEQPIVGSSQQDVIIFALGMSFLTLAIMSPIMYWSMVYLWMHILFHILVMIAAPPLIAFSKPWKLMQLGLPDRTKPIVNNMVIASKQRTPLGIVLKIITNPKFNLIYFEITMVAWFIPQMMTWAVENKYAMMVMHFTFITSGMLLFLHLIDSDPFTSRVKDPVKRLGMIGVCAVTGWIIAMFMGFAPHAWYPVYALIPGKSMSPMADQQIAASLLWVLCMEPFLYSAYYNIKLWISMSENNTLDEFRRPWLRQG